MRMATVLGLGFGFAATTTGAWAMNALPLGRAGAQAPSITKVEYFCSPGYAPSYGGRCIATPTREEIDLYLNETYEDEPVRIHRRRGLRERY